MRWLLGILTGLLSVNVWGNSCFPFAETYYQQIYCEIQASGKGSGLPSFGDFRRNNEQMQALLLKPLARRAGVAMAMPKPKPQGKTVVVSREINRSQVSPQNLAGCQVEALTLVCPAGRYQLIRNQANDALATGVLATNFRMDLPVFQGNLQQQAAVDQYLVTAYQHYLKKMLAIGLGGATMNYGKFAFLFADLNSKGLDFSARFEKMFTYLKADKQKLRVPVRQSIPRELDTSQCYALPSWLVCPVGLANLLFARV